MAVHASRQETIPLGAVRDRLLANLAEFIWRRPWLVVIVAAVLAGLCAIYAATTLRLNANLDDLIAPDRPYMQDYRRFLQEFGDLEYIIIAIDASKDRPRAEAAADALLARLRAIPGLPGVHGAIESDEQLRLATRNMSDSELRDFALAAEAFPGLLSGDAARVIGDANAFLGRLVTSGLTMSADDQQRTGAAAILLLEAIASTRNPRREIQNLIQPPPRRFLDSDTGRLLFINVLPAKDYSTLSVIEQPLRRIREAIAQTRREFADIDIGLTGKPVMQYDEMATSNTDMTRASIIALVLCAALFMIFMGGVKRPLLAVIAFVFGAAWTYGFATLTVGQLNLLSLVFMLVLVGVGLDYGVHVINRYQEFRIGGDDVPTSLRGAVITAVRGNITGALTSSIVFFMAVLTTFRGLRELGLIAGGGLLLCLIAMSVVLPALLAIVERRSASKAEKPSGILHDGVTDGRPEAWFVRHARGVLIATLLVTAGLLLASWWSPPPFEFNLLGLQARGLESIEWEHRILNDSAAESWFGAIVAENQQQALEAIERAKDRPTIGAIRSVFDLVQPDSPQRDTCRAALHATNPARAGESATVDLAAALNQSTARLEPMAQAAAARSPVEAQRLQALVEELRQIDPVDTATRQAIDNTLSAIARTLRIMLEGDAAPLRDALPQAVRDQFISADGRLLVMLHPKQNVWEYEPMKAFIADLRAVDAGVTGVPVTHFESLGEMRRAFMVMSMLSLLAIIVLLSIDFRSLRDVLLALAPLLVGLVWTVAAMGLLGLSFNLANFFAAPMLIGLGVDSAVHILHRYHEGGDRFNRLHLGHTRRAVILTALTTIIGFGALVIARHRGLQSLGLVMAIGSTACMLSSIIVLPALLAWRERTRTAHA